MTALVTEQDDEHHACQWAALLYDPHLSTSLDSNIPHIAGVPLQAQESSLWREGNHDQ